MVVEPGEGAEWASGSEAMSTVSVPCGTLTGMSRGWGRTQLRTMQYLWALMGRTMETDMDPTASPFQIAFYVYEHSWPKSWPTESQARSVRRALLSLQRRGDVERVSHGRYAVSSQTISDMAVHDFLEQVQADPDYLSRFLEDSDG